MPTKFIDASVAAAETSSTAYPNTVRRRERLTAAFSIVVSSAANVDLQGRMSSEDAWHKIGSTFTATGIANPQLFPQMRTVMDSNDGTVSAWIDV